MLRAAERELRDAPHDVKQDVYSLLQELVDGRSLGMPISRPLPSIAKGLHELRLSGRAGEYRVFYVLSVGPDVVVIHAGQKKSQKMDKRTIGLLKSRIRSLGL